MLTYIELAKWVAAMTLGLMFAVFVVVGISVSYSGGIWLFMSEQSPVYRLLRRRGFERMIRRETADLDARLAELTSSQTT